MRGIYLDPPGSDGDNYDKDGLKLFALPDTTPDEKSQLYDLEAKPGETTNHETPRHYRPRQPRLRF